MELCWSLQPYHDKLQGHGIRKKGPTSNGLWLPQDYCTKRPPPLPSNCVSHIWTRVLEIDSTCPTQVKRCSVEDVLEKYRTDYRRRGSRTDVGCRNARKGQAAELALPHSSPGATPDITESTSELRQADPDSLFGDVLARDARKAAEKEKERETWKHLWRSQRC